ncbi:MAG: hypothetical protein JST48_05235 [Bacteroidetes bacterium]|nr:hypothetical protein [Bacteroidota bacterium]
MYSFQFWKQWPKPYRFLFWVLAVCFLFSLGFLWQGWIQWPAPAITLDNYQQIQSVEVPMHSFNVGLLKLTAVGQSNVIIESIFGSDLQPSVFASYFFLAALVFCFLIFISILPALSRYRFLIGIGIAALFIASLQLDALQIFNTSSRLFTAGSILLFASVAFYFHSFKVEATFLNRLFAFSLLTLALSLSIYFSSGVPHPFLHISVTGLMAGLIVCLIVIVMVAHEWVALFAELITRSTKLGKNLQHFLVLSIVYLGNIFLMYSSKMGMTGWSFFSVSPFVLLGLSAILGVWGFRAREPRHESILKEEPLRIYFYVSLATAALGVLGYFLSSANDMMVDAFEDLILAAHIGCGLIFVLYVIANFGPMLVKNLPVYKILYKPDTMPHFTFRLMSVIATFAILSMVVSWKTYVNQMVATYYNAYGDLFLIEGDTGNAEVNYRRSLQFRNQNLHAHYALANIYKSKLEPIQERKEYENGVEWSPDVPAYLNLCRAYLAHNDLLETALTLDRARKEFPNSKELQNATGISFLKLKQPDSAIYYFSQAKKQANVLAVHAVFNKPAEMDSIVSLNDKKDGVNANTIALANLQQKQLLTEGKFSVDTSLNVYEAVWLSNFLVNQKEKSDTALIGLALELAKKPINGNFEETLITAAAHSLYEHGLVNEAMKTLRELAFRTGNANQLSTMGLWLLEQKNPSLAINYFEEAQGKSHPASLYHLAIAQIEANNLNQAIINWDSLRRSPDKKIAAFAEMISAVLKINPNQAKDLTDEGKYYFCRYRIPLNDNILFNNVINAIADHQLQAQAIIDRSEKLFAMDEPDEANDLLGRLNTVYSKNIHQQITSLRLMLAVEKRDWEFIQKNIYETALPPLQKKYLEALLAAQNGSTMAANQFEYLCKANYQFEEGVIAAVRFFENDTTDRYKNFSRLVEGLLAKPNSVKYLKQHAVMAASLAFYDAAQSSLDKLRAILPDKAFKKFAEKNRQYFKGPV